MRLWFRWPHWDTGFCELLSPLTQAVCASSSPQPRPITTRGIYSCALHSSHTGWFEDISAKGCGKAGVMFLRGSSPCSPLPGRAQFQSAEGRREALVRAWPALRTRVCQAPEGGLLLPFPFLSYLGPQEPGCSWVFLSPCSVPNLVQALGGAPWREAPEGSSWAEFPRIFQRERKARQRPGAVSFSAEGTRLRGH